MATREKLLTTVREDVAAVELEQARQAGTIGKALDARVVIEPGDAATQQLLTGFGAWLETVLIVSQAEVGQLTDGELRVKVSPAAGQKCVRCWRWTTDAGTDAAHPELCGRCAVVVAQRK